MARPNGTIEPPAPWRSMSSEGILEFSQAADGGLHIDTSGAHGGYTSVVFRGLPRPLVGANADYPLTHRCMTYGRPFFEPVSSIVLPDGSVLAAMMLCFADSPHVMFNENITGYSLVAWRSVDNGTHWDYRGIITDAKDYVSEFTRGNTEENDMAVMADGKTVMIVMRTDGDCTCDMAKEPYTKYDDCGVYRPYYQSYSTDFGSSWTRATPIPGTGCARPRLLSLGADRPMLMSGGRMCWANETGLFVWLNPSGLPNAAWQRFSLSYQHNQHWAGAPGYLFDDRINETTFFETQAYTSLMQVGDMEAVVVYNKFYEPSNGEDGCYTADGSKVSPCSTGFAMRMTLSSSEQGSLELEE